MVPDDSASSTVEPFRVLVHDAGIVLTISCVGDLETQAWTALSGPVTSDKWLPGDRHTIIALDGPLVGQYADAAIKLIDGRAAVTARSGFHY